MWSYGDNKCTQVLRSHESPVRGLCWSPEVAYLLYSGSWDYKIILWNVVDGCRLATMECHSGDVYGAILYCLIYHYIYTIHHINHTTSLYYYTLYINTVWYIILYTASATPPRYCLLVYVMTVLWKLLTQKIWKATRVVSFAGRKFVMEYAVSMTFIRLSLTCIRKCFLSGG